MRRRTFLRRTAATAAGLATLGAVQPATAAQLGQPDTVTIDYPESLLAEYAPRLVTRTLEVQPDGWWAWRARSPEYEGAWLCYWAYYPAQVGLGAADSHVPDREPVYLRLDGTGSVDRIVYDSIHYLIGTTPPQDTDRVRLQAINPWHNYTPTLEQGTVLAVNDLRERYEAWLDAGWSVSRRAVTDPPTVLARGHWWRQSETFGISIQAIQARLAAATNSELLGSLIGGT